eukprot:jgi/Ulvmu1/4434/UM002_0159.1
MSAVRLSSGSKSHAVRAPFQEAGVRMRDCTLRQTHFPVARRELVISYGKGKNRMRQGAPQSQQMRPPTPPVDPDNEEFVIFVRATKLPRWIPFTIVKGGAQANLLVKAMNGNFGKEFYSKTLINNIAQAVYKDRTKIVMSIRENMPGYKSFMEYDFGFKVRNKESPESWIDTDGIVLLPAEEDVPKGPLEGLKSSVTSMFKKD